MKSSPRALVSRICLSALIVVVGGCSVSQKTLDTGKSQIDALKSKGVPDSILSTIQVYWYQAKEAKARDDKGLAWRSADSMKLLLRQAEAKYQEEMTALKPDVDALINTIQTANRSFSGIQRKSIDSAMRIVDSFVQMNWLYKAKDQATLATAKLPSWEFNQKRAEEIWPRLFGRWVCVNKIKSDVFKEVNGEERIVFDFRKDTTGSLTQSKKGQTGRLLKEDWTFIYSGKFDVGGDTIYLSTNRFQGLKEHFEEGVTDEEGKVQEWRKKDGPPVDSTITDRQYDRSVTFSDLVKDFKQEK